MFRMGMGDLSEDPGLDTSGGRFPLFEYRLRDGGREWTVLHTGTVLTEAESKRHRLDTEPATLWRLPLAIGHRPRPAHRRERMPFAGGASWNFGAGIGLPGISRRDARRPGRAERPGRARAMHLCKRNGERNDPAAISTAWPTRPRGPTRGATIGSSARTSSTGDSLHPHLRRIFESNLAGGNGSSSPTPSAAGDCGSWRPWRLRAGASPFPSRTSAKTRPTLTRGVRAVATVIAQGQRK